MKEEEVLLGKGLDVGADFRADETEEEGMGLVADVKVARFARVEEALVT